MSDENNFPIQKHQEGAIQLHENGLRAGSLIEQSLSRLNAEQAQTLLAKASEEALRLEVKSREQNMDYVTGKKATEDHIDAFNMLDKSGRTTRQTLISDVKTGAGNMRIESKSGATCFVASVAYGDPNHLDVIFLRGFRDEVLSQSELGRELIAWYWRVGPKLARIVGTSVVSKKMARIAIGKLVSVIKLYRK